MRQGKLETFLLLGSTFNPTTETKTSYGGVNSSSTSNDKAGFAYGIDFSYFFNERFALSGLLDGADYAYPNTSDKDSLLFIGIAPKVGMDLNEKFWLWGALGLGALQNRLMNSQYISNGILITGTSRDSNTFGISPRVGVDYKVSEKFAMRLQVAYTKGEFSYDFNAKTYPGMVNLGDGTVKLARSWFTGSIGLNWSL
jgi:opacity protein-like surface antigen